MRRGLPSTIDRMCARQLVTVITWWALILLMVRATLAEEFHATPDTYRSMVPRLSAGDTILLEPGNYLFGLTLHGLMGTPDEPIVIRAADRERAPRFLARPGANTISIVDSAHIVLKDLVLEGQGIAVDAIKAEGHARFAHHVTLERLKIHGHDANQQVVAISTKCPAWGWIIRDSVIDGAGTGIYLGDSDGSDPFSGGIIEGNEIRNTLGYNLQIKHQSSRSTEFGAPTTYQTTIIRQNRFTKGGNSSPGNLARPNLLLGHFPLTGLGSTDRYLVYGNVFSDNPTEALFQAEGNVAAYNNLFVNRYGPAINIQAHKHRPRWMAVFSNTVVAAGTGIVMVDGELGYERRVRGNAVFADEPLRGEINGRNFTAPLKTLSQHLANSRTSGQLLEARPIGSQLYGAPRIPADLASLPGATFDLTGRRRTRSVFGACMPESVPCPP